MCIRDREKVAPFSKKVEVGPLAVSVYNPEKNMWEERVIDVGTKMTFLNLNSHFPHLVP